MKLQSKTTINSACVNNFYVNLRVEVAAVSRNRYGVEQPVDTHTILINAIKFYVCLQEI
jgi:hypothetical protein